MLDWLAGVARRVDGLNRQKSSDVALPYIADMARAWRKAIPTLRKRVANAKRMAESLPQRSAERLKYGAKVAQGEMDLATTGHRLMEFWDAVSLHMPNWLPKLPAMQDGLRLRPGADETDDALLAELRALEAEARHRAIMLAAGIADPAQGVGGKGGARDAGANGQRLAVEVESVDNDAPGQGPALTKAQQLILCTLAGFDSVILASTGQIAEAMNLSERLSERTITPAIRKLVKLDLAERPEGDRQGVRLTIKGRRLAPKIDS